MERPEHLFQLVAPGLRSDFPVPRSEAPPSKEDEFNRKIDAYVERELERAFGAADPERVGGWLRRLGRRNR
jgi:hypothetical protein